MGFFESPSRFDDGHLSVLPKLDACLPLEFYSSALQVPGEA